MRSFTLLLCFMICFSSHSQEKNITIVADEWCPINCVPGSKAPGYMIEIIRKVFKEKGIKVEYKTMSWSRALANTRDGLTNLVVGAYRSDAPDFIFPDESLGFSGEAFYVTKGSNWRFTGGSSLSSVKFAVVRDYSYGPDIDAYIAKNKLNSQLVDIISGNNVLKRNVDKLIKRRVSAIIENEYVMAYFFNEYPNYRGDLRKAGNAYNYKNLYAAFSPKKKSSKDYAKTLSEGIKKLRKNGELKKILDKYNIRDWSK